MAKLKFSDFSKMSEKERKEKMQELKFMLLQSSLTGKKTNISRREIKKSISRLLTLKTSENKRKQTKPLKRADVDVLKKI